MTEEENANRAHVDAESILTAIDSFTGEVKAARVELGVERDKRKVVTRIVAGFLGLSLIGGLGNFFLYQEIQAERKEDNLERCENFNNLSKGIRQANAILVDVLVRASGDDEASRAIGDAFLEDLAKDFPMRSCDEFIN